MYFWEIFNLWCFLLMIIFYHQTKTLIDFWYKRWLNSQISYLIIRGFTSWANWNLQEPLYCLWHKGFQNSIGIRIFSQKKKKKKNQLHYLESGNIKHGVSYWNIFGYKKRASIASSFWFTTEPPPSPPSRRILDLLQHFHCRSVVS